jgi:hypothetical protein
MMMMAPRRASENNDDVFSTTAADNDPAEIYRFEKADRPAAQLE